MVHLPYTFFPWTNHLSSIQRECLLDSMWSRQFWKFGKLLKWLERSICLWSKAGLDMISTWMRHLHNSQSFRWGWIFGKHLRRKQWQTTFMVFVWLPNKINRCVYEVIWIWAQAQKKLLSFLRFLLSKYSRIW